MVHLVDDHVAAQLEVFLDLHELFAQSGSLVVLAVEYYLQQLLLADLAAVSLDYTFDSKNITSSTDFVFTLKSFAAVSGWNTSRLRR